MSSRVREIVTSLSLRAPQAESLRILDEAFSALRPADAEELAAKLARLREKLSGVEDFERAFPSLCFALATGVGKTRLMGAFIAYLFLEHDLRNFFVLAPNLTIYKKLIADFTPGTPKYVFRGLECFATNYPRLITGDNYEDRPLHDLELISTDIVVNVFNISKFNARAGDIRKMRRLSEILGESYFDYLAGLPDLVILMDEAHRYRGDASMKAIEELKPLLGLELTATPQIEGAKGAVRFKNIAFDYPLHQAMHDKLVKEPAVATRENFDRGMLDIHLEHLKLADGVRVHEHTKAQLEIYGRQHGVPVVKPFMLVIASDTAHADRIVSHIASDDFYRGYYKNRVIQVHSGQKGAERDEVVERLLAVENPLEPTEIVVHVNMLKEGWDVTNLFTIVPLRAADSKTLVEQSIGRGLRLPYGQRVGVAAVDRLTIIAHERFDDIVNAAKEQKFEFQRLQLEDVPPPAKLVTSVATVEAILGLTPVPSAPTLGQPAQAGASSSGESASARATLEILQSRGRQGAAPILGSITAPETQLAITAAVAQELKKSTRYSRAAYEPRAAPAPGARGHEGL
ncbi:MAG: DEAD/DEAH box helicase family protein [Polyangiaceae bacterium]|nr:DEAD/DEAH box helicase family protein [Polyangiaceae bacterium]